MGIGDDELWRLLSPNGSRPHLGAEVVEEAIGLLDEGLLRFAERLPDGTWRHFTEPLKRLLLEYFRLHGAGIGDSMPLKTSWPPGVRVSPSAVVRRGAHVCEGAVLLPCQVGAGAWIGPDTMLDTFSSVGTGAQIGARVHLAQHAGIGGVLEPEQEQAVIVEDDCFIGSHCSVTEGVLVRERAVLGAGVQLTRTIPILDLTGRTLLEHRGEVPPGAVVVPGSRLRRFPAGEVGIACACIVGWRDERTDARVALNRAARRALAGLQGLEGVGVA